jgi:predicted amidophosphoribosyltransferase
MSETGFINIGRIILTSIFVNNTMLTLNLLTTTIVAPPSNARKWQMGFNSAYKGLKMEVKIGVTVNCEP